MIRWYYQSITFKQSGKIRVLVGFIFPFYLHVIGWWYHLTISQLHESFCQQRIHLFREHVGSSVTTPHKSHLFVSRFTPTSPLIPIRSAIFLFKSMFFKEEWCSSWPWSAGWEHLKSKSGLCCWSGMADPFSWPSAQWTSRKLRLAFFYVYTVARLGDARDPYVAWAWKMSLIVLKNDEML